MQIKTTGVEDYIDGSANIKMLEIGGPGAGKTRSSSYWPRPIYADCENGRGSIADRKVAYADIKSSQDMLDFLSYLKGLERIPKRDRQFQTVVIDTVDAFSRRVKDEWIQLNKASSFKGYDAWGYLETKMSALMTRLLNLDYNVIVLAHYKDKTVKNGDQETHEIMLQLQGDLANSIFNDFDLVGWLGTYWQAEDGERVEKRGLSFHRTYDRPFLKDRFGVMPQWVPINFDDDDYGQVFNAFLSRVDDLTDSEVVGEIGSAVEEIDPRVVSPSAAQGALPPIDPKDVPLNQFDKPTLATMARNEGCLTTVDGAPIKGNTLKGELVAALTAHRAKVAAGQATADAEAASPEPTPPAAETDAPAASPPEVPDVAQVAAEAVAASPTLVDTADAGQVDITTGEITQEQAVERVTEELGGQVLSETPTAETPSVSDVAKSTATCALAACDEVLADQERPDYARISYIKFRHRYCNAHFQRAKTLGRALEEAEA